jgi:hypothetical protein
MQTFITAILVTGAALAIIAKCVALFRGKSSGCGQCGQASNCSTAFKADAAQSSKLAL